MNRPENNEREQIRGVAKAWRQQYLGMSATFDRSIADVQSQLDALDAEVATAADVAAIVGNDSWITKPGCVECGRRSWEVIELGVEDEECGATYVCADCLIAGLNLLGGTK